MSVTESKPFRLLLLLHEAILEEGFESFSTQSTPNGGRSLAGNFNPLRYSDGRHLVVIRALAMFDDLVVNATATLIGHTEPDARRRVVFDCNWLPPDVSKHKCCRRFREHVPCDRRDATGC